MLLDARQATVEQVATVVGRDHDRTEGGSFGRSGPGMNVVQPRGFAVRLESFHEVLPQKTC